MESGIHALSFLLCSIGPIPYVWNRQQWSRTHELLEFLSSAAQLFTPTMENAWQCNLTIVNTMMWWSISPQKRTKTCILECRVGFTPVLVAGSYNLKHETVFKGYSGKFNFRFYFIKTSALFLQEYISKELFQAPLHFSHPMCILFYFILFRY